MEVFGIKENEFKTYFKEGRNGVYRCNLVLQEYKICFEIKRKTLKVFKYYRKKKKLALRNYFGSWEMRNFVMNPDLPRGKYNIVKFIINENEYSPAYNRRCEKKEINGYNDFSACFYKNLGGYHKFLIIKEEARKYSEEQRLKQEKEEAEERQRQEKKQKEFASLLEELIKLKL